MYNNATTDPREGGDDEVKDVAATETAEASEATEDGAGTETTEE